MRRVAISLFLAAVSLAGVSCSNQRANGLGVDQFRLFGIYIIEISGTEGSIPFQGRGTFDLATSGSMVTGTYMFEREPATIFSGTIAGTVSDEDFDFVMTPDLPASPCAATFTARATISTFKTFSGIIGGGCSSDIIAASFATAER